MTNTCCFLGGSDGAAIFLPLLPFLCLIIALPSVFNHLSVLSDNSAKFKERKMILVLFAHLARCAYFVSQLLLQV